MASSKKVRGLLVEIGGDTTKLEAALKKVDKTTSSLSKELKGINSLLKFDSSSTTLLSQRTKVLAESIGETEERLNALKQAQSKLDSSGVDKNTADYRDLQREIEKTQLKLADLKNESSNWTKAGKSIEEFGNKISKVSNKISNVGNALTIGLTAPIVALGVYATKSAIEFESAFAGVLKTVDGTSKQLANLKQGILDMSEVIPASTTEIASVAEAAGQLGIATDDILAFTEVMIKLGFSTNLSSTEAAISLARLANIMGTSASDYQKLGSAIVDLGNNFATTEQEIVEMSLRIAGAGTTIGLSEANVLGLATALSSVGIEAQMGGSAISKAMIDMSLAVETGAGKFGSLKEYAKVANMSVKEFSDTFGNDAVKAITAFITGLGDTERLGSSTLKILSELGFEEVRLRDTLLRTANASELLNSAVDSSNKAWKENNALTVEANKRIETLESQMKMAKNKVDNLAISFGNELLPHLNKLLDVVGNVAKKFSEMSEEEQISVLRTLALVAAIGPAIKIIGTLGSGIGTTVKGIGTFTKAIGLMKNGIGTTEGSAATLAKVMKGLTSPIGLATIGITALVTALIISKAKMQESINATKEQAKKLSELAESYKQANDEINKQTSSELYHIESSKSLFNELTKIVDENGRVKEGYEDRAKFITSELASALGIEISLIDGIIANYQQLQEEMDAIIIKKKAQILLDAEEQKYNSAIGERTELYEKYVSAQNAVAKSEAKLITAQKQYDKIMASPSNYSINQAVNASKELSKATLAYEENTKALGINQREYENSLKIISNYQKGIEIVLSGNVDDMNQWVKDTTIAIDSKKSSEEDMFSSSIALYSDALTSYQKFYNDALKGQKDAQADGYKNQVQNSRLMLQEIVDSLKSQTSTINKNSEPVINGWKSLASSSKEVYNETLMGLEDDVRNVIVEMTGVPYDESVAVASSFAYLAQNSKDEFDAIVGKMPIDMKDTVVKLANTIIQNSGQVTDKTKKMMDSVLNEIENADSEKSGKSFMEGINKGLSNESIFNSMMNNVGSVANNLLKKFKKIWDINSPSGETEKLAQFFMKGLGVGFKEEEKAVVDQVGKIADNILKSFSLDDGLEKLNGIQANLNQQITDATKTVFTTPNILFNVQELNEQNLQKAFDYVNKKFGSDY